MSPTNTELTQKAINLEKQFEETMDAIRKLAQQQISNIELLSRLNSDIADLKIEIRTVKEWIKKQVKPMHDNKITRYE